MKSGNQNNESSYSPSGAPGNAANFLPSSGTGFYSAAPVQAGVTTRLGFNFFDLR